MKVNMFITSNVVKDKDGNVKVQACNHMFAMHNGKQVADKVYYKQGANSSIAILNAYVYGLNQLKYKCDVEVHTDIQYLVYTTNQLKDWADKGYINSYGKPCKNKAKLKELLKALNEKVNSINVTRYPFKDRNISSLKEDLKERLLKKIEVA